jgi:hypothetical protein
MAKKLQKIVYDISKLSFYIVHDSKYSYNQIPYSFGRMCFQMKGI